MTVCNHQCKFDPTTRNDKQQNEYLKVILEEVRGLRTELKKLEAEVKVIHKLLVSAPAPSPRPTV